MVDRPEPPYEGYSMSPRWRNIRFNDLPRGIQKRLLVEIPETVAQSGETIEAENVGV